MLRGGFIEPANIHRWRILVWYIIAASIMKEGQMQWIVVVLPESLTPPPMIRQAKWKFLQVLFGRGLERKFNRSLGPA